MACGSFSRSIQTRYPKGFPFKSLCSMKLKKDLWVCVDEGGLGGERGYDRIRMRFFIEDGSWNSWTFVEVSWHNHENSQTWGFIYNVYITNQFQTTFAQDLKIIGLTDAEGFLIFRSLRWFYMKLLKFLYVWFVYIRVPRSWKANIWTIDILLRNFVFLFFITMIAAVTDSFSISFPVFPVFLFNTNRTCSIKW